MSFLFAKDRRSLFSRRYPVSLMADIANPGPSNPCNHFSKQRFPLCRAYMLRLHFCAGLPHNIDEASREFSDPRALSEANSLAWNQVLTNAEGNGSGINES